MNLLISWFSMIIKHDKSRSFLILQRRYFLQNRLFIKMNYIQIIVQDYLDPYELLYIHHSRILFVLQWYGTPLLFFFVIHNMYTNLLMVLKVETNMTYILHTMSVCQGKIIAPVIFLFMVSTLINTLYRSWKRSRLILPTFHCHTTSPHYLVCLIGHILHTPSASPTSNSRTHRFMYVYNGAFFSTIRENI